MLVLQPLLSVSLRGNPLVVAESFDPKTSARVVFQVLGLLVVAVVVVVVVLFLELVELLLLLLARTKKAQQSDQRHPHLVVKS